MAGSYERRSLGFEQRAPEEITAVMKREHNHLTVQLLNSPIDIC